VQHALGGPGKPCRLQDARGQGEGKPQTLGRGAPCTGGGRLSDVAAIVCAAARGTGCVQAVRQVCGRGALDLRVCNRGYSRSICPCWAKSGLLAPSASTALSPRRLPVAYSEGVEPNLQLRCRGVGPQLPLCVLHILTAGPLCPLRCLCVLHRGGQVDDVGPLMWRTGACDVRA
jgi:hypothetical protein